MQSLTRPSRSYLEILRDGRTDEMVHIHLTDLIRETRIEAEEIKDNDM